MIKNKKATETNCKFVVLFSKRKKGAMEMSVGTIVTIVLLMAVLVLGLVLTRGIFKSAKGAIELTDQQLKDEIGKAFGSEDEKTTIYPESGNLDIKQEERDAIGLGIKNLLEETSRTSKFSYEVKVAESKCGNADVLSWIEIGKSEDNIPITVGDYYPTKINFRIPLGSPLCIVKYRVEVKYLDNTNKLKDYDSISFTITSKAK